MKSIKLMAEDRPGLAADITEILGSHNINIEDLDGRIIDSQAIVEMVVDKPHDAVMALRQKGFKVVSNELVVIRIVDEPGASAKITRELNDAKLSIRGISTMHRQDGYCYVALSTDNDEVARKLLHDVLI
ncbi:MAG TPA: ACT domain-containing protein [Rickettsiales bacterium]|nr:ACT domain-containing protein [Rickettsiales bacterium]